MPVRWKIEDRPDHLLVRVEGSWQLQPILQLIEEMGRRCRSGGHVRVFCDFRAVSGQLGEVNKYLIGTRIAIVLGSKKLAALMDADAMITQFTAKIAAQRGGRVFATKDPEAARQWLFAEESED